MILALVSVRFDDITVDEQDHLNYGVRVLKMETTRQINGADFNTTMPVSALNALPRAVEQLSHPGLEKKDFGEQDTKMGRNITILAGLILLLYVFCFAKAVAGPVAGNWALVVAAVDPNILAHSRLVTTDIYSVIGFTATLYHLYQWRVKGESRHFYFFATAIAIAQVCKINNILLYPVCLLVLIAEQFAYKKRIRVGLIAKQFFLFAFIQLVFINLTFFFYNTGMSLSELNFKSNFFKTLQQSFLGNIPLPLPQSYIDTFDLTQYERESFTGTAQNYLLGELRYQRGFWYYYLICWMVKTPLITQLLIMVGITAGVVNSKYRQATLSYVIVPSVILLLLLSSSSVQSGYRYLLPILILGIISLGVLLSNISFKRYQVYLLAILLFIPAITAFPNYLAYSSEWLIPKRNGYLWLADSNFNWGQRSKKIGEILKENPGFIYEPIEPTTGKIVVDINNLTGITNSGKFEWLRNNFKPVRLIEGCYLLYEVDKLP